MGFADDVDDADGLDEADDVAERVRRNMFAGDDDEAADDDDDDEDVVAERVRRSVFGDTGSLGPRLIILFEMSDCRRIPQSSGV